MHNVDYVSSSFRILFIVVQITTPLLHKQEISERFAARTEIIEMVYSAILKAKFFDEMTILKLLETKAAFINCCHVY